MGTFRANHYASEDFFLAQLSQSVLMQSVLIKFAIPSKENDEQIKSNLRTSFYCKIDLRLVANMVQDELRNKYRNNPQ